MTTLFFMVHAVIGIVITLALRLVSFMHIPGFTPVTWSSGEFFVTSMHGSCQITKV